jgi:hypothetical protein
VPWIGWRVAWRIFWINLQTSRRMPQGKKFFYPVIACVHPDFQAGGVSLYYSRWIFAWADKEQAGIYIETSNEENVRLWTRIGFGLVGEEVISGIKHWFFWRDPKPPEA